MQDERKQHWDALLQLWQLPVQPSFTQADEPDGKSKGPQRARHPLTDRNAQASFAALSRRGNHSRLRPYSSIEETLADEKKTLQEKTPSSLQENTLSMQEPARSVQKKKHPWLQGVAHFVHAGRKQEEHALFARKTTKDPFGFEQDATRDEKALHTVLHTSQEKGFADFFQTGGIETPAQSPKASLQQGSDDPFQDLSPWWEIVVNTPDLAF